MIIEKNKPIPEIFVFDFSSMENGDSVFIEEDGTQTINEFLNLSKKYSKKSGSTFLSKEVIENGLNGVRVWCLKPSHNQKLTNKIRDFIKTSKNITKKDIYRHCFKDMVSINKSLEFLYKNENLQSRVEQTTGRPKTIYYFETNN